MSNKIQNKKDLQAMFADFSFSKENDAKAKKILKKYPPNRKRSGVIPLLDIAQRQCGGWLPQPALDYVADYLDIAPIRVYEVATFYSMFNLKPVGENFVQICRTTPCWLRGSDDLLTACQKKLGVKPGEVTSDGKFSYVEVECLGACANAPMVQINDDYYEDLTVESFEKLLKDLEENKDVKKGSQQGRQSSEPKEMDTMTTDTKAQKVEETYATG